MLTETAGYLLIHENLVDKLRERYNHKPNITKEWDALKSLFMIKMKHIMERQVGVELVQL